MELIVPRIAVVTVLELTAQIVTISTALVKVDVKLGG